MIDRIKLSLKRLRNRLALYLTSLHTSRLDARAYYRYVYVKWTSLAIDAADLCEGRGA